MTFGQIKTYVDNQLLESYSDKKSFKKSLLGFKEDVLGNKSIAKLYSLYEELSSPQGLSERDAVEFVNEGIILIQKLVENISLPNEKFGSDNNYKVIDNLVYNSTSIKERVESKKELVKILTQEKTKVKESVNIPISSMVKIANQTIKNFIQTLDETSKKELESVISEDTKSLKIKFNSLKEDAAIKLNALIENESNQETKSKISETITKIKNEKFDQLSYFKLKKLVESL
jgi:hypothetical protein